MVSGPIIKTERLTLRPVEITDAAAHYACMTNYAIVRNFTKTFPWPYPEGGSEWFINHIRAAENDIVYWAIVLKEKPETMIGAIEVRPNIETSQIAFWLSPQAQGSGYMTEAATAAIDYWFGTLEKDSLHTENAVGNNASRRVQEKTGATYIGRKICDFVDPEINETEMWLLTKEDWLKSRKA
jgi:ribosomal-protein-alanine N-acetyltransferase